jgi:hypothetical protein
MAEAVQISGCSFRAAGLRLSPGVTGANSPFIELS